MAGTVGFETKAAFQKEVKTGTYPGTVIAVGANDGIPFLSESIQKTIQRQMSASLDGGPSIEGSDITGEFFAGDLTLEGRYRGLDSFIASAMGFEGPDSPSEIEAGIAYKHLYELDEILATQGWLAGEGWVSGDGLICGDKKIRRGTLCFEKSVSIWEYQSAMINGMTIRFNVKDNVSTVQFLFNVVAYDLDRASSTNPSSTSWTIPAAPTIVMPGELVLRLAEYAAGGLVSGDAVRITDGEIVLESNLLTDEQTTASGLKIEEPVNDGIRVVRGSFNLSRYQSDDFIGNWDDQDLMMMDVKCTGDVIPTASSATWQMNFYMPRLRLDNVQSPISGPGKIPQSISWVAERPSSLSLPTGFPSPTKYSELLIEAQNDLSTNFFTTN